MAGKNVSGATTTIRFLSYVEQWALLQVQCCRIPWDDASAVLQRHPLHWYRGAASSLRREDHAVRTSEVHIPSRTQIMSHVHGHGLCVYVELLKESAERFIQESPSKRIVARSSQNYGVT